MELRDDDESTGLFEPLMVSEDSKRRSVLSDLALDLAACSEGFKRSLPPSFASALADLVRSMNCYYSNLIEGHDTHPVDIERALKNDYSADPEKRNLQLEAKPFRNGLMKAGLTRPRPARNLSVKITVSFVNCCRPNS